MTTISRPDPTAHEGDGPAIAAAIGIDPADLIDLSANVNPFAPDIPEVASQHLNRLAAYPDARLATRSLAKAMEIDLNLLVLTNGGAEAIALVAARLGSASTHRPDLSLFRRRQPPTGTAMGRWRSNPSYPLGRLAAPDDEAEVWDETFFPLATGFWTRDDASWRLGSLSNLWGCPGLRLGYVIAPTVADAEAIKAAQPRWAVNGLALAMVPQLLALTDLQGWAASIARHRLELRSNLEGLGYEITESAANWILIHNVDAPAFQKRLLEHHIVVSDCTNFGLPTASGLRYPVLRRPTMWWQHSQQSPGSDTRRPDSDVGRAHTSAWASLPR